jgi:hypothetical protein
MTVTGDVVRRNGEYYGPLVETEDAFIVEGWRLLKNAINLNWSLANNNAHTLWRRIPEPARSDYDLLQDRIIEAEINGRHALTERECESNTDIISFEDFDPEINFNILAIPRPNDPNKYFCFSDNTFLTWMQSQSNRCIHPYFRERFSVNDIVIAKFTIVHDMNEN